MIKWVHSTYKRTDSHVYNTGNVPKRSVSFRDLFCPGSYTYSAIWYHSKLPKLGHRLEQLRNSLTPYRNQNCSVCCVRKIVLETLPTEFLRPRARCINVVLKWNAVNKFFRILDTVTPHLPPFTNIALELNPTLHRNTGILNRDDNCSSSKHCDKSMF